MGLSDGEGKKKMNIKDRVKYQWVPGDGVTINTNYIQVLVQVKLNLYYIIQLYYIDCSIGKAELQLW